MKIIIAPDSFKGCLSALEVAQSIEKGIRKVYFKTSMVTVPLAAGGLGASFLAFLNAKLKSGIEIVVEILDLGYILKDADLVITGEGKIDKQSIFGKIPELLVQTIENIFRTIKIGKGVNKRKPTSSSS